MTNEQALNILYNASRRAPLSAEDHEVVRRAAEQLLEAVKAPAVDKAETQSETP